MCFSATASIISFTLATTVSIILFIIGTPTLRCLSIFSIYVAILQLLEYILWKNIKCNTINHLVTKLIPLYLFLQPILLLSCIYSYNIAYIHRDYILYLMMVYIFMIGFYKYITPFSNINSNKKICSYVYNKSLVWGATFKKGNIYSQYIGYIYYIGLLLMLLINQDKMYPIIYVVLSSLTFVYNYIKRYNWHSYWCYSANMIPLVLLIIYLCRDYII